MSEPIKMCAVRQLSEQQLVEAAAMARAVEPANEPLMVAGTHVGNTEQDYRIAQAILTGKKWPQKYKIKISFLKATPNEIALIKRVAQEWFDEINLEPVWMTSGGEVRIAVNRGGGSWSFLSTDCWGIKDQTKPTMVFGWLDAPVIRHEFAHGIIGMIHEHQHPERGFQVHAEAAYKLYGEPPNNWSRQEVYNNVIYQHPVNQTNFERYAPDSISHYHLDERITVGDFSVGYNTVISPSDKTFARSLYPKTLAPVVEVWRQVGHWYEKEDDGSLTYRPASNEYGSGAYARNGWYENKTVDSKDYRFHPPKR